MKLNQKKCEALAIRGERNIRYRDGTKVPPQNEARYLGCMLNDKGDVTKEVNKRLDGMLYNMEKTGTLLETLRLPTQRETSNIRRSNKNKTNVRIRICTLNRNTKRKNRCNAQEGTKTNNENRHDCWTNAEKKRKNKQQ